MTTSTIAKLPTASRRELCFVLYIMTLFVEPSGQIMVGIAGFMMIIGVILMKKMINIKV